MSGRALPALAIRLTAEGDQGRIAGHFVNTHGACIAGHNHPIAELQFDSDSLPEGSTPQVHGKKRLRIAEVLAPSKLVAHNQDERQLTGKCLVREWPLTSSPRPKLLSEM